MRTSIYTLATTDRDEGALEIHVFETSAGRFYIDILSVGLGIWTARPGLYTYFDTFEQAKAYADACI